MTETMISRSKSEFENKVQVGNCNPGRRCIGSNKDGNWLVFIENHRYSVSECCFLWNPKLQLQVQLPCLPHPSKTFFKCLVTCYIDDGIGNDTCCYKVYLFYKHVPYYIWCTQDLSEWETIDYSNGDPTPIFSDVVLYGSSNIQETFCGITPSGSLCIASLRMIVWSRNMMFGNRQRRLVVCHGIDEGEDDRLLLLERIAQCSWEVWELDSSTLTWVSLSSLEGLIVFLGRKYSAVYKHRPNSGLVGNCICFTEDEDDDYFYLFSIADQTVSIFRNLPHSGFPAWFPNMTKGIRIPWLSLPEEKVQKNAVSEMPQEKTYASLLEDNVQKTAGSEMPQEKAYEITGLDPEECYARGILYRQLYDDLQRSVAECLHNTMDYANYRLVCRNWREIAPPIRWKSEFSSPHTECPWLMSFDEKDLCTSFYDPSCNMTYIKANPELSGCKVRYSTKGWLLVTRGIQTVFFFEPLTKTKISVPDLPRGTTFDCMTFSSSPTCSNWIIIAVLPARRKLKLWYLRPVDKKWNLCRYETGIGPGTFINSGCNLVFHDNKFNYLCQNGSLAIFDPETKNLRAVIVDLDGSVESLSNYRKGYLVSCEYDLYLVITGSMGKFVNLCKLDNANGASSKWKRVKVLPTKLSFFISQTSSVAVQVTEKAQQNTINLPLFVESRHACYKLDTSEFTCYGDNNSTTGLLERKELHSRTWLQPKVTRGYR